MQYPVLWALFAVFLLTYVFPFVVTLLRLLRWEVLPIKMTRQDLPLALDPLHQAAVDEITALGFVPAVAYRYHDGYQDFPALMLKHPDHPAYANIYLQANAFTGYPAWFWGFAKDGRILLTANRQPVSQDLPGVTAFDPYVADISQHWQAHQTRVAAEQLESLSAEEAYRGIAAATENHVAWNLDAKNLVRRSGRIFFSFRKALAMTWESMRRRRDLRKPYKGAAFSETFRSAYYAEMYAVYEAVRPRLKYRIDVAVILLVLSFAVSFGLFSVFGGWRFAAAILIVLFIHEMGHALVMRLFGYRDMSMFFIPFAGAVVTGSIKDISVWRQTIVLLAGPMPGLLAGLWIFVHYHAFPANGFVQSLGWNAVLLNLFNLLPLSFLDGGKLVEIAILSRWPYALFAFSLVSSIGMFALIIWLKSYNLWLFGALMALVTRAFWRIAGLRRAWAKQPPEARQLKDMFELAEKNVGSKSFNRQYYLVRSVYEKSVVDAPRPWETALALGLFFLCWAGSLGIAWSFWHHDKLAEKNFDAVVSAYYKAHDAAELNAVAAAAQALDPDDPRQIDLRMMQASHLKPEEKPAAVEKILMEGRDGWVYRRPLIVQEYLGMAYYRLYKADIAERITKLAAALDKVDAIAPELFADAMTFRLRLAELYDQSGNNAEAQSWLSGLFARVSGNSACCARQEVEAAQAWHDIDKGNADKAAIFLRQSALAADIANPGQPAVAYGWALFLSGKNAEGLLQMQRAEMSFAGDDSDDDTPNLDLIYAYQKNGLKDKAAALIPKDAHDLYCDPQKISAYLSDELWQAKRKAGVLDALKGVCALPAADTTKEPGRKP